MSNNYPEYSLAFTTAQFFLQTSTTSSTCDATANSLVGGSVIPVPIRGNRSYTVYAGPSLETVVQFRLKSLMLAPQISALAREVYGVLAPEVSFHGPLLGDDGGKEAVFVYVMSRVRGISHLDFVLANSSLPRDSEQGRVWRKRLWWM